ncbi:SGNH/GDSL hydrolase family protein [Candidatus Microgenomates bacterium]|nr:SGNH/GDSL hydrolase family protein [Candidatus Microgenomates bacterium]
MKKVILNFLKVFLVMIFLLVSMEAILRVFWRPAYLDPKYKRNDLGWAMENVVLNKFGYRDREFDLSKKSDTYRIYVLGDSYGYGWYINDLNNTLPKILEEKIANNNKDKKIEVINATRPGFSFTEKLDRLKDEGLKFTPDILISEITLEDFVENQYPPKFTKVKFIKNSLTYQFFVASLERARVAKLEDQEIIKTYSENSQRLELIKNQFKEFAKLSRSVKARPVIVIFPHYDVNNLSEKYKYQTYHDKLSQIAKESDINFIDLSIPFEKTSDKNDLILNPTDPHPSVKANEIAADYILNNLFLTNLLSEWPTLIETAKTKIEIGTKLPFPVNILQTYPNDWVYFDAINKSGVQSIILPNKDERQIKYYEDKLKTSKSFSQGGWIGGRIEHYIVGAKEFEINKTIYKYEIAGINQIKGYYREEGGLISRDLRPEEVEITKVDGKLKVKVNTNIDFELYKISLDLVTKQFDMQEGLVTNFTNTKYLEQTVNQDTDKIVMSISEKLSSVPRFSYDTEYKSYLWINDKLAFAKITIENNNITLKFDSKILKGSRLVVPVSLEMKNTLEKPVVDYLKI